MSVSDGGAADVLLESAEAAGDSGDESKLEASSVVACLSASAPVAGALDDRLLRRLSRLAEEMLDNRGAKISASVFTTALEMPIGAPTSFPW